jgi:anti-sigma factor RsiW
MDCRRAEELLSDDVDGLLDPVLAADLRVHLAGCEACRELRAAIVEVVAALKAHPVLEPPAGLAERAAGLALRRAAAARRPLLRWPDLGLPAGLQVLAAVLALCITGATLLAASWSGDSHEVSRLKQRAVSAGVSLLEKKDRLVEDLRLLRAVVATAFEGRLDRVNDRVNEYRRLLEKRRASDDQRRSLSCFPGNFFVPNSALQDLVKLCERPRTGPRA